jgi:hypothetical protein
MFLMLIGMKVTTLTRTMMTNFTTKYNIGDQVYYSKVVQKDFKAPCPDCLDTRKWKAVSPAGNTLEMNCPRCSAYYQPPAEMRLNYMKYVGQPQTLTIGSAMLNTAEDEPRYMCEETGVGSGAIYPESQLFLDYQTALDYANIKAEQMNEQPGPHKEFWTGVVDASSIEFGQFLKKAPKK